MNKNLTTTQIDAIPKEKWEMHARLLLGCVKSRLQLIKIAKEEGYSHEFLISQLQANGERLIKEFRRTGMYPDTLNQIDKTLGQVFSFTNEEMASDPDGEICLMYTKNE